MRLFAVWWFISTWTVRFAVFRIQMENSRLIIIITFALLYPKIYDFFKLSLQVLLIFLTEVGGIVIRGSSWITTPEVLVRWIGSPVVARIAANVEKFLLQKFRSSPQFKIFFFVNLIGVWNSSFKNIYFHIYFGHYSIKILLEWTEVLPYFCKIFLFTFFKYLVFSF